MEALEAPEQLRWANDHFGSGFAVTTSFGTQSAVLLHLLVGVVPSVPVFWIDTGYL
ncbi:MAG: phosphoadenosine phosphosulfate reductase family protein, partial [Cyanobacteriota bacterium]|nr:phosphoadenosine phosphosulfate reductase family protein [Cyanobacteriota bacterium]